MTPRNHTDHTTTIDGVRVRYIEAGEANGGPPVVLVHGFQAGADLWYPHTLPAIAAEHHVVALDLPGFGYSGQLEEYSAGNYGLFLSAFFDSLGMDKVDLVGHSMGGQVSIAAAAQRPRHINRLVLVDSAGLERSGARWKAPLTMLADRSMFHVRLYPTVLRLARRSVAMRAGLRMLQEDNVRPLLPTLTMPTLVIWGSRDRVIPMEHGVEMARAIPGARLAVMRGCGHMPFYQRPKQFNRIFLSFIRNA